MSAEPVVRVDPALPIKAVAAAIGVSRKHFWRMRQAGRFPEPDLSLPSLKEDGDPRPRWYASTVQAWLGQHERRAR